MLESLITALIYIAVLVLAVYIVIWFLGQIGIAIPDQIMKIIWVIVVLFVLLILVTRVLPGMGLRLGTTNPSTIIRLT